VEFPRRIALDDQNLHASVAFVRHGAVVHRPFADHFRAGDRRAGPLLDHDAIVALVDELHVGDSRRRHRAGEHQHGHPTIAPHPEILRVIPA